MLYCVKDSKQAQWALCVQLGIRANFRIRANFPRNCEMGLKKNSNLESRLAREPVQLIGYSNSNFVSCEDTINTRNSFVALEVLQTHLDLEYRIGGIWNFAHNLKNPVTDRRFILVCCQFG